MMGTLVLVTIREFIAAEHRYYFSTARSPSLGVLAYRSTSYSFVQAMG